MRNRDSDILLAGSDWTGLARRKLEGFRCLEEMCDLPQAFPPDGIDRAESLPKVSPTTFFRAERDLGAAAGLRRPKHRSGRE